MIEIIDWVLVFFYGMLITLWILGISPTEKNVVILAFFSAGSLLVQAALLYVAGESLSYQLYPIVVHIPLFLLCVLGFGRSVSVSVFAVCSAYIMTTPRKWVGEFLALPFGATPLAKMLAKLFVSVVILVLVYYFLRPAMKKLIESFHETVGYIAIAPLLYYIVAYIVTVYTGVSSHFTSFVEGIVGTTLAVTFYLLLTRYFMQVSNKFTLESEKDKLRLEAEVVFGELEQIERGESTLREYKKSHKDALYKIKEYIKSGELAQAEDCIAQLEHSLCSCAEKRYCENEKLNTLLNYYAKKTEESQVALSIKVDIPQEKIKASEKHICLVFAKGIELALADVADSQKAHEIELFCYVKNKNLFVEINNTHEPQIIHKEQTEEQIEQCKQSILLLSKKYGGVCSFQIKKEKLIMRAII